MGGSGSLRSARGRCLWLAALGIGATVSCNAILGVDQDYAVGPLPATTAVTGGGHAPGGSGGGGIGGAGGAGGGTGGQGNQGGQGGEAGGDFAPELDGTDDFIVTPRPLAEELTIEAWIRTTAAGSGTACWLAVPLVYADQLEEHPDFSTCILEGGRLGFSIGVEGAADEVLASDDVVNSGQWVHIAAAKGNDGWMRVFVNGVASGQRNTAATVPIVGPEQILFGGNLIDGRYYEGRIREVRLWGVVRSEAEIGADFNRRLVGNEPGLIGYWPLDEGTGTTAYDLTANSNHATLGGGVAANMPAWVADGPPLQP